MTIICAVGDLTDQIGFQAQIVNALSDVPIVMISYGASANNISFLIHSSDKEKALHALSQKMF